MIDLCTGKRKEKEESLRVKEDKVFEGGCNETTSSRIVYFSDLNKFAFNWISPVKITGLIPTRLMAQSGIILTY
jgi:hypothetical protein